MHLDGQSTNSEYGSPYLATLHFTFTKCVYVWLCKSCFLNEGQFKTGFVKKLKPKDGSVPIVHDPAAPPEEESLAFNFFMIICESRLLFHRRERWVGQSSLACKEHIHKPYRKYKIYRMSML